ncbi:MAG: T9SS type A sorting domain-containing protein [Calditrichaceae bacterium]|nr:T9SS type A sorting domain-containing protein [Calditrichia bacterium]NUQ44180.1 T9SS type A sorting domain-containing protein [Calditrichaceae bacterium]
MKTTILKYIVCAAMLLFFQAVLAQGSTVIFSATGDVPYGSNEIPIFQQQIADHNLYSPSKFLIHLGDIKEGTSSCPESIYQDVSGILKELAAPCYIVPGDNEYNDCSDPTQAWQYWTAYFMRFEENFCGAFATEHQSVRQENFAFLLDGVLFVGINLVGGRVHSQNEWNTRMQQDADWVDFQFQNKKSQVRAAVVFAQAGPDNSNRDLFFNQFRASAATFAKPVLFMQGDGHSWKNDKPFPEQNITRVQVNNGGEEDPVQVTVNTSTTNPWVFLRNPWSNNPPLYNVPPCVEAGPDTTITLPGAANLHARVKDDGVPLNPGAVTLAWSKTSGPGTVIFANPSAAKTTASFSAPGTYLLRLTASDGSLQNYDELIVTVNGQGAYLAVNDATVTEGNSGTVNAVFTVTLSGSTGQTVTVNYATANGTAAQGSDYTAQSGTLTFSGSTVTRAITVAVIGDLTVEPDETFFVNLSGATNATIGDGQGLGTILNDDVPPPPVISSFSPAKGPHGTQVTITGSNFSGATQVAFNTTSAPGFIIDSDTRIRANVPSGATSGKIRVTNPAGSALSATDFIITHTLAVTVSGSGSVTLDPPGGVYDQGSVVTLTAVPAAGWQFLGWSGDLSGSANPAGITMNGNKNVTAGFVEQGGGGSVVYMETRGGGAYGTIVTTSASLAAVSGDLYLAAISTRPLMNALSVSGLGLTWTRVQAQCSGRGATGVEVWMALGTPSASGPVSAAFPGNANAVITVSRYSGVAATNPIGTAISGNTLGLNGACSGGVDNSAYSFDLNVSAGGAMVYCAAAMRNKTHTPGSGYSERIEIFQGASGNVAGLAIEDRGIPSPALVTVNGTFSGSVDWAVAALEIKPGNAGSPPPQYTLTLNATGSGSVSANPPGGVYDSATVVTLTASPAAGYQFSGWSGDLSGSTNPAAITMNANKTVTATFTALPQYTLTVNIAGSGTVTLNPPGGVYTAATVVTLTAAPAAGFVFSGWSGDLSGSANPAAITMDANKTVTATFTALPQYTLTANISGNGTVQLNPPGGIYNQGTVVSLTAVPGTGFRFSGWSGDLSGTANPASLTMDANKTVTATFTPIPQYTLTLATVGSGAITANPPATNGVYDSAAVVTLTAVPDAGWRFSGWSGDLSGTANPASLTMNANKTVTATFAPIPRYTLTLSTVGLGAITADPPAPGGVYDSAAVVTLTANADPGWTFSGWSGDLSGSINPEIITMNTNKTVVATFTERMEVVYEQTVSGGAANAAQVTTSTAIAGVSGDLYLAAISTRPRASVSAVSGLGLSWTRLAAQCAGRNLTGVEIWMAQGNPGGNGAVTAVLSNAAAVVLAVSRYSGVDATAPVGNLISGNTVGLNGPCSGGSDNSAYALNLPVSVSGAMVYSAVAIRNRTHTPGAGYSERIEIFANNGFNRVGIAVQDQSIAGPGNILVNGTFSGSVDWAVIGLEIKPRSVSTARLWSFSPGNPATLEQPLSTAGGPAALTSAPGEGTPLSAFSSLQFEVKDLPEAIRQAKLRLYGVNHSPEELRIYPLRAVAEERRVNAANLSAPNDAPLSGGVHLDAHWIEYDLTALIRQSGSYVFAFSGVAPEHFNSLSSGGDHIIARLIIETAADPSAAAPATDSSPELAQGSPALSRAAGSEEDPPAVPEELFLNANYPNPFNSDTRIEYGVPEAMHLRLVVYNLLGQQVRKLTEGYQPAGAQTALWDGRDDNGVPLGSGIYFIRLRAGDQQIVRKAILQK